MSKKIVITSFGDSFQVIPPGLTQLNEIYGSGSFNGIDFDAIGRKIPKFKGRGSAITGDGYEWFWALNFGGYLWQLTVLFPLAQDWEKIDGSQLDRSISVYVRGTAIPLKIINRIIKELEVGLEELSGFKKALFEKAECST